MTRTHDMTRPCDCGAWIGWATNHNPSCAVFVTNDLNLHLITRFLTAEVEKNNGIMPDWLRHYDLWALQALAEMHTSRQRDHRWDDDQYRDEQELGGRRNIE